MKVTKEKREYLRAVIGAFAGERPRFLTCSCAFNVYENGLVTCEMFNIITDGTNGIKSYNVGLYTDGYISVSEGLI